MGKNQTTKLTIDRKDLKTVSEEEHLELTAQVEDALKLLASIGAAPTDTGMTAFKLEGLFTALIELAQCNMGISQDAALRWADAHYLRSIVRFIDSNIDAIKTEATKQKLGL